MKLLRSEAVADLDTLFTALHHTAHVYEESVAIVPDGSVRDSLDRLRAQRLSSVDKVAEEIRRLDDAPSMPDPDKETLNSGIAWIKRKLEGDEVQAVIAHCREEDQSLLLLLDQLRSRDYAEQFEALYAELVRTVQDAQNQLSSLKSTKKMPSDP